MQFSSSIFELLSFKESVFVVCGYKNGKSLWLWYLCLSPFKVTGLSRIVSTCFLRCSSLILPRPDMVSPARNVRDLEMEREVRLTPGQQNKCTAQISQLKSRWYCQRSDTFIGNDRGDTLTVGFSLPLPQQLMFRKVRPLILRPVYFYSFTSLTMHECRSRQRKHT